MSRVFGLVLALLFVEGVSGQDSIRWKGWGGSSVGNTATPLDRGDPRPYHALLEFAVPPTSGELAQLRDAGAVIAGRLSDRAFAVRLPHFFTPGALAISWTGTLAAADKLSPLLRVRGRPRAAGSFVVEFYPDVDMADARSAAARSGVRVIENPDLNVNNLLLQGTPEQISALAGWDGVQYIFPASPDLLRGVAVHACAGALTSEGPVSQGVATVGEGWDGPGRNPAALGYAFAALTDKLPAEDAEAVIVEAFNEWARFAKLTFSRAPSTSAPRTLTVLFARGPHGDPYPFDGPGKTIAHTFYPYPLNPEPMAGDLHFDADESWRIGTSTDLFTVALHEAGHGLGLGHSDNPADVMYPYYRRVTELAPGDIAGILKLYAAQDGSPEEPPGPPVAPLAITVTPSPAAVTAASVTLNGTVSGGEGEVQVDWRNGSVSGVMSGSRAWTAAIPLVLGPNAIVITARDERQDTVTFIVSILRNAVEAASIRILQPSASGAYTSESGAVAISGFASDPAGISRVSWISSRGGGGQATGTTAWSTPVLTFVPGETVITVTAWGNAGGSATQSITITYAAPQARGNDTTAPALRIISPAGNNVSTSDSSIILRGIASDASGVASVTWSSSSGGSGEAIGTTAWTAGPIPLYVGANRITIRAADASGNTAWRAVMVTRSP